MATEILELENLVVVGTHIVEAALLRKESRGGHYNLDYPPKPRPSKEAPHVSGRAWKKRLSPKPTKEADLGKLIRGSSPPRTRFRDIVFRSQAEPEP